MPFRWALIFGILLMGCDSGGSGMPEVKVDPPDTTSVDPGPMELSGRIAVSILKSGNEYQLHYVDYPALEPLQSFDLSTSNATNPRFGESGDILFFKGPGEQIPRDDLRRKDFLVPEEHSVQTEGGASASLFQPYSFVFDKTGTGFFHSLSQLPRVSQPVLYRYTYADSQNVEVNGVDGVYLSGYSGEGELIGITSGWNNIPEVVWLSEDGVVQRRVSLAGRSGVPEGANLQNADWNAEQGALLIEVDEPLPCGASIAVYYPVGDSLSFLTSSATALVDESPQWGPVGHVLFLRREIGDVDNNRLMGLDLETSTRTTLITGSSISEGMGVHSFDFIPQ